jgi:glycosyltransferase involved in cell wall biosynthesis
VYAGHNPADSAAAIRQLEDLRGKGARFLLFPATALWWLDYYAELRQHLEARYKKVVSEPEVCVLFALQEREGVNGHARDRAGRQKAGAQAAPGVNLAGCDSPGDGLGEAVRATARAAKTAKVPYALDEGRDPGSYPISLVHGNAADVPGFVRARGEGYFRGHYNIGYWDWEWPEFPAEWSESFRHFHEIWVPSSHALEAVSRAAPVPVLKVPYAIEEPLAVKRLARADFDLPERAFVFLSALDFHSPKEMTNPAGLLKAFKKAFQKRDKARLVLQVSRVSPADLRELTRAAAGANVVVIDRSLAREEAHTLMKLCDCYVSLHRAGGFGLLLAEAMSLEKPVIATAYSGNTDFMTAANSLPVNYQPGEVKKEFGHCQKGWVWAEPDLDHAAELMRRVSRDQKLAKEVGRKAREDVLRSLHPRAVGALIRKRLQAIVASGKVQVPPIAREEPRSQGKPTKQGLGADAGR